jgi:delta-aminolevulinic acid dehydratase/porphobilinogen synthase
MKIAKLLAEATARPTVENSAKFMNAMSKSAEALVELVKAADQCLDDMGETGHCVCPAAKEWLREALAALPDDWKY